MSLFAVGLIKALRPHHWIKNFLVFVPLIFSNNITSPPLLFRSVAAFILFSAVASSVYVLNDLVDMAADRQHPWKRFRPFASGVLKPSVGVIMIAVLLAASLIGSYYLSPIVMVILSGYFFLNILYSFYLKNSPPLDILLVALFYVIRAIVGAYAILVLPTNWLIITTFFASLYFVTLKRYAELSAVTNGQKKTRKSLNTYTLESLNHFATFSLTATVVSYTIYTTNFSGWLYASVFPLVGMLARLMLVRERQQDLFEAPEKVIFYDKIALGFAGIWVIMVIIYHWI